MNLTIFQNKKNITSHDLENMIEMEHAKIMREADNDGKHDGMKQPAMPLAKGDKLIHHIHFKSRYESLALKILKIIKPISQLAEGKMDKDLADAHSNGLTEVIINMCKQIEILTHELRQFDPSGLASRIRTTHLISFVLFIGEVFLNMMAFQVMGDSLISCLLLSISVSLAISFGAHFAGRKYKDAKSKMEKWIVVIVSTISIGVVASVIASLRTIFLHRIGVDVNPLYFTVFNAVLFFISALATVFFYPTKTEIEQNRESLDKYNRLKKLEKEVQQKQKELQKHKMEINAKLNKHLSILEEAEYCIARIKIMYRESVDEYKKANRLGRKEIPDCFNDAISPLDIPEINFQSIINKYKQHENNNSNSVL